MSAAPPTPEPASLEPPARPPARGWRGRLWIYGVLLVLGVGLTLRHFDRTPQSRLAGILSAVEAAGGAERVFTKDGAFLAVFPQRGYVLTLFVGDSERCAPAQYMTLRRMDQTTLLELMIPTSATRGAETRLEGPAMEQWLSRVGISRSGVERALARHYPRDPSSPGG